MHEDAERFLELIKESEKKDLFYIYRKAKKELGWGNEKIRFWLKYLDEIGEIKVENQRVSLTT